MIKLAPETNLASLSGIGPGLQKKLKTIGLKTIKDLLYHFPRRYEDFSKHSPIIETPINDNVTIKGKLLSISSRYSWKRKRMNITEALVKDNTASIKVVWFNKPYLEKYLKKGTFLSLSGKTSFKGRELILSNPDCNVINPEESQKNIHIGALIPIYSETLGLSSRWIRKAVKKFLPAAKKITDSLPIETKKRHQLLNLQDALKKIHSPKNQRDIQKARERFAFEEILSIQIKNELLAIKRSQDKAHALAFNQPLIKKFVDTLPFNLTDSQKISAWEILRDLEKSTPMNRLLEGDVGSGKTAVAAIAALQALHRGYQATIMAPTEVLARQHFETVSKLFLKSKFSVALLTGSEHKMLGRKTRQILKPSKTKLTKDIREGKVDFVVGTHAIISTRNGQGKIKFQKLALAIVDEQHRFGVNQRAKIKLNNALKEKPHLLTMTATPIPRTLALAFYGDLYLSIIKELPAGRQKIKTEIIPPKNRGRAYEFIRKEIKRNRQAFVICPLIEESDKLESKSVLKEYEHLSKKIFPDLRIAYIHGKLKSKEKEKIMEEFKRGKIDILLSTSVVEVGIDVPNATVMMIEGAERFGLAQLHQFRGRVGRGQHQSYCFLFTDSPAKNTRQRLKALIRATNSFELAEEDLKIRGPGQFFGTRQSGEPDIAMESITNIELIKKAREEARFLLEKDVKLKRWPALKEKVARFEKEIHLE